MESYVCGKRNNGRSRRWLGGIKEDLESINMMIQKAESSLEVCTRFSKMEKDPE